jgi:hypothetical protein
MLTSKTALVMLRDALGPQTPLDADLRAALRGWAALGAQIVPTALREAVTHADAVVRPLGERVFADITAAAFSIEHGSLRWTCVLGSANAREITYFGTNLIPDRDDAGAFEDRHGWDIGTSVVAKLQWFGVKATRIGTSGWPNSTVEIVMPADDWRALDHRDAKIDRIKRLIYDRQRIMSGRSPTVRLRIVAANGRNGPRGERSSSGGSAPVLYEATMSDLAAP